MQPELFSAVNKNLAEHEGRILSMYPDSNKPPVVTCGIGHALFAPADGFNVIWWKDTNTLATREEVKAAWSAIRYAGAKRALMMTYEESTRILMLDLEHFEKIVRMTFPQADSYPLTVQVAIYDLAFNTGSFKDWPHFTAAILARDFKSAAKESNRPQVSTARNEATFKQLDVI
jgi:GH24 family phage-related lysozyme (muramidase)